MTVNKLHPTPGEADQKDSKESLLSLGKLQLSVHFNFSYQTTIKLTLITKMLALQRLAETFLEISVASRTFTIQNYKSIFLRLSNFAPLSPQYFNRISSLLQVSKKQLLSNQTQIFYIIILTTPYNGHRKSLQLSTYLHSLFDKA